MPICARIGHRVGTLDIPDAPDGAESTAVYRVGNFTVTVSGCRIPTTPTLARHRPQRLPSRPIYGYRIGPLYIPTPAYGIWRRIAPPVAIRTFHGYRIVPKYAPLRTTSVAPLWAACLNVPFTGSASTNYISSPPTNWRITDAPGNNPDLFRIPYWYRIYP